MIYKCASLSARTFFSWEDSHLVTDLAVEDHRFGRSHFAHFGSQVPLHRLCVPRALHLEVQSSWHGHGEKVRSIPHNAS